MIKYLLIFLLPISLFAAKILSYNIYDRTDRADVMITFDTPYNGIIKQSRGKSKIIIKLEDASIESPKIKKVSSRFLHSVIITPMKNETRIVAAVPQSVKLIASKTADGYGLRLRFTDKSTSSTKELKEAEKTSNYTSALPTQKESDLTQSYYVVVAILIIGIIILLYVKRKTTPKQQGAKQQKTNWLFNANSQTEQTTAPLQQREEQTQTANEVSIRFQKAIDASNSVVMLDFGKESYLVLMGNSNILLDKFHENRPSSQQEFESILQSRHDELENFLNHSNRPNDTSRAKEPLQAYKERAASLIYSDEL
jgi:hypothetical protein